MSTSYQSYEDDSLHLDPSSPFFWDHISRYWWIESKAKGLDVLDCACGKGYGSFIMSHSANSVTGIDLNQESIEIANSTFKASNLSYQIQDVLKLGEWGRKFDIITAFEVIEHIPPETTDIFLASFKQALKPNGKLIISTPNHDVVLKSRSSVPSFHINNFRSYELKEALERHFSKVNMIGQFVERTGIQKVVFDLDFLNLRHVLKNFGKPHSRVQDMKTGGASNVLQKTEILNEYISRPQKCNNYVFSENHWRQAGLSLATCQL